MTGPAGPSSGRQRHRDPHDRARALHARAVAAGRYGDAAGAIRTLRRGLDLLDRECADRTDCTALTVELLLSLAVNEAEVNGVGRGRAVLDEARPLLEQLGDGGLQLRMHNNHALIATRAGDLQAASAEADRALSLLSEAGPQDRVYTLLNSGNIRLFRGELVAARRLLTRAVAAARDADIADGEFRALHNLGYVEFLAGNLPAALNAMDAAAELDVEVSRGIWALDRARILLEAGLIGEADATLAEAGRLFATARTAQDLGEVEVARAECALLRGDAAAARRFATRARNRFRRRGNELWMRRAELVLLQGDLAAGRPPARLAPVAARLAEQLVEHGQSSWARTAALVGTEALIESGRLAEAADVLAGLSQQAATASIAVRVHGRYVRAALAEARGDSTAARREIRAGQADLAGYQAGFGSIDLRTASAVHGRRLVQLDVAMAVSAERPAAVLAALERGRAVSTRLPPVRPPSDEQSAQLLTELRTVVEQLRAGAATTDELLTRRAELTRQIRARAWAVPGAGRPVRAAPVDEICAAVAEGDLAFVGYVHAAGRAHAVVADGRRLRLEALGGWTRIEALVRQVRADYDVLAIETLNPALRRAAAASLRRGLHLLDDLLIAPLQLSGRAAVVAPTGLLATLPWAALPSRRGLPTTVAPSATAWLRSGRRRASAPGRDAGVIALSGPGLHRAAAEIEAVAGSWSAGIARTDASRADVVKALADADVVHVAAHGQHQVENPLFSSLQLSDGPLFAWELEHSPAHVVLSACEVGTATVRPGDEALGLTSVLLHLGTVSVVSSVARVGDLAAERTMAAYHARLAAGDDSAQALAAALVEAEGEGEGDTCDAAGADGDVPPPFVNFGGAFVGTTGRLSSGGAST